MFLWVFQENVDSIDPKYRKLYGNIDCLQVLGVSKRMDPFISQRINDFPIDNRAGIPPLMNSKSMNRDYYEMLFDQNFTDEGGIFRFLMIYKLLEAGITRCKEALILSRICRRSSKLAQSIVSYS